jgi:hypothetical protein
MEENNMATRHSIFNFNGTDSLRVSPEGVHSGTDVTIQNLHASEYVYIGGATVDSENFGYRLAPGSAISFELSGRDALYAVSTSNAASVAVLYTSLEVGS